MSGAEEEKGAASETAVAEPVVETGTDGAENRTEPEPAVETAVTAETEVPADTPGKSGKKTAGRKAAGKKTAAKKAAEKAAKKKAAAKKAAAKKAAAKKAAAKKAAKKKSEISAENVALDSAETAPKQKALKPKTKPKRDTKSKPDGKAKKPDADAGEGDPFTVARRRVRQSVPKIVDKLVEEAVSGSCAHAKTLLEMTGARHMFDGEAVGGEGEPWAKLVLERLKDAECAPAEDCAGCAKVHEKESGE